MLILNTAIDINETVRNQSGALCQNLVYMTEDLAVFVKRCHWNVRGSNFLPIHKMFDDFWGDLLDYTDTVAERIVQLGGIVMGPLQVCDCPVVVEQMETVRLVVTKTAELCKAYRESANSALALNDQGTANIFIDLSNKMDKWLWFLESHLFTV